LGRQGVDWEAIVRKENNSFRVILKESGIWTPEDPDGPPPMILFGPNAIFKIRSTLEGEAALSEMLMVLGILYQNRSTVTEEVPARDWDLVGSFGGGKIPLQYRLELPQLSAIRIMILIIIHLLGLAPAGYLAAPDNGAWRRLRFGASQVPNGVG
jgi:hypothetical protein